MSEGARARLGEAEDEEGESEEAKLATALEGVPEASDAKTLDHYNQPLVSQAEPNFLNMIKQMTRFMGDPNEVRKAEQELDNLRMKESGHVSLYIAEFRILMSGIGDWGERA
ncbi:hypothetical protein O181_037324 [Austropuccinia psidii MF-1]|uniref:Retrotransposon gag domain-containing protein n=1 Tax=Austropuccinia psidii MF-1 TaxID=1389203 RepID=A0A9Q3D6B3_9BASI|nr:hypothetical protein [Austropuccinia psidii MF-1]